jgi:hypothetical protein
VADRFFKWVDGYFAVQGFPPNGPFCWTELGARQVSSVQSLLTTRRLHEVAPYDYLVDIRSLAFRSLDDFNQF